MRHSATQRELIDVAQGRTPADLLIRGGMVANVYSGEFLQTNIAICKDKIAYVGEEEHAVGERTRVIDAEGLYLSPGFIEPHAHPWVLYNPVSYTTKALALGTTTIAHDNLFFFLHMGECGFRRMVEDLRQLPGNNRWLIRLVSQAAYPGEKEDFHPEALCRLLQMEEAIGTAEVTRWPLLYNGDEQLLELTRYAKELGKVVDGHTSGCSYEKLNSLAAAGISACHEAITAKEALDRLRLGLWTVLRNSSLRPDFPELIPLIAEGSVPTNRLLMTTDGPHPGFLEEHGCVGGLIRSAVQLGAAPMQALQMATINPATYLKLDDQVGGIAPGKRADLLVLPNLRDFRPELVISGGEIAAENGRLLLSVPRIDWNRYGQKLPFAINRDRLADPDLYPYRPQPTDRTLPVIHFRSAVITKLVELEKGRGSQKADLDLPEGLLWATLIDRQGTWISRGILERFAVRIDGFASTYNTTTHLLAIGRDPRAMAKAALRVHELGGGIVLVEDGEILLEIPLPLAGMMITDPDFSAAVRHHADLLTAMQQRGYPFHDILYTLLFLTCDSLPGLRLTPYGLYEVQSDRILRAAESLETNPKSPNFQ